MSEIYFETEYRLLMSPAIASTKVKDNSKRPANSPASSGEKKSRVENTELKLAFKKINSEVDQHFFEAVCSALSDLQSNIPNDVTYPGFYGCGFKMGIGWFYARDEESMTWLKSALSRIIDKQIIPDLEVLPYTNISPLRRTIFSVPMVPRLGKDAKYSVIHNITRLNPNLSTNYWRVLRVLPPQGAGTL